MGLRLHGGFIGRLALALLCLSTAEGAPAAIPAFRAATIDDQVGIGYGVAAVDVDGDSKLDIVLVDADQIRWYRNPDWQRFILTRALTEKDHVCIAARDNDGDGKAELAAGAGWNPGDTLGSGSVHALSPQEERTERWETMALHHEPTVHRMRWLRSRGGPLLVVAPLHGRGNEKGEGEGVRLLGYRPPSKPGGAWGGALTLLDGTLHMTHNIDPVQWDDDEEEELLVIGREGVFVLDERDDGWWRKQLGKSDETFPGGSEVRLGTLPGKKRFLATVEPFHGNQLVAYTEPTRGHVGLWQRHVVDDTLKAGHAVACGDVAHRGSDQVVVGWRSPDADGRVGVRVYAPEDDSGTRWSSVLIDDNKMACEDLRLADLNGDGWLDIVAAGRATKNLVIYWNEGR